MEPNERQVILDEEHLRLLGIGYYVFAGMNTFIACMGLMYVAMGAAFTTIFSHLPKGPRQEVAPAFLGFLFVGFGLLFMALALGFAALNFTAARRLKQRRSKTFCTVVAALSCLSMPWGTLIGVMTLIVLARPTVIAQFDRPTAGTSVNGPR